MLPSPPKRPFKPSYRSSRKICYQNSSPSCLPLSVTNTFQKFMFKIIYKKFKRIILALCRGMDSNAFQKISPQLAALIKNRKNSVEVMFRLYGETWPPMIVYKAKAEHFKVIGFKYQELNFDYKWNILFSDTPIERNKSSLPPLRNIRISRARTRNYDREINKKYQVWSRNPLAAYVRRSLSVQLETRIDIEYRNYWKKLGVLVIKWHESKKTD
ncbi:unnamed protein product [Blepharisma stoltei]|uniref:Uncharacterized protein n=1 Tax=Blepharisma stoltei TaxID=1481888 RepID=A0AAU9KDH4_9CILI|nr:unnamed protein product [Blepharisma stoltei]